MGSLNLIPSPISHPYELFENQRKRSLARLFGHHGTQRAVPRLQLRPRADDEVGHHVAVVCETPEFLCVGWLMDDIVDVMGSGGGAAGAGAGLDGGSVSRSEQRGRGYRQRAMAQSARGRRWGLRKLVRNEK